MRQTLFYRLKSFINKLGPGLITGASDDDPSGILTYLQAGAVLGFKCLWTALLTLPFMYAVQEMCARLGLVTNKGLIRLIKENYSKVVLYPIVFVSVLVITINIGADFLAIGVVLEKLTSLDRVLWLLLTAASILVFTIFFSYKKIARILKWLVFSLFFYIITIFLINFDWWEALHFTLIPSFSFSKQSVFLIAAIFGTTISPYLFFWQASEEAEERQEKARVKNLKRFIVTKHELKDLKEDTFLGMVFSNVVMWFIIAGASQLAATSGLKYINNFDEASLVLQPLLGNFAYFFFSMGIIGAGLLAVPVLAGAVGYILSEVFGWEEGMNRTFRQAKGFYIAIIGATTLGVLLTVVGLDPIQLLIYTAIFYTLITPVLIFFIWRLANNKKIMRNKTSSLAVNVLGILAFFATLFLAVAYILTNVL